MGSLAQHESVGRDKQVKVYMMLHWSDQIICLQEEAWLLGLFLHHMFNNYWQKRGAK